MLCQGLIGGQGDLVQDAITIACDGVRRIAGYDQIGGGRDPQGLAVYAAGAIGPQIIVRNPPHIAIGPAR